MEPTTAIGTGLAILGSKDILTKLLGPTADYVGGEVRNLVEKCNVNLDNIFRKATEKLGNRIEDKGIVSPRVLKHVLDEGRFCEDELASEYYGGILASSRSQNGRDDRGVTLLAVVKDLSVYQLRFHFLVYSLVNRHFKGQSTNLGDLSETRQLELFVPITVYDAAMDFSETEDRNAILSHCLFGLGRHDLIANFSSGQADFLRKKAPAIDVPGIILTPTLLGAELFLWAIGLTGASGRELLHTEVHGDVSGFKLVDGSTPLAALKTIKPSG